MTEQEALKYLKDANRNNQMVGILPKSDIGKCIIKALEENQQYRATGTQEECRAAVEKMKPKRPDECEGRYYACPVCDNILLHKWIKYPTKLMPKTEGLPHCMSCGQAIDWSDEE